MTLTEQTHESHSARANGRGTAAMRRQRHDRSWLMHRRAAVDLTTCTCVFVKSSCSPCRRWWRCCGERRRATRGLRKIVTHHQHTERGGGQLHPQPVAEPAQHLLSDSLHLGSPFLTTPFRTPFISALLISLHLSPAPLRSAQLNSAQLSSTQLMISSSIYGAAGWDRFPFSASLSTEGQ